MKRLYTEEENTLNEYHEYVTRLNNKIGSVYFAASSCYNNWHLYNIFFTEFDHVCVCRVLWTLVGISVNNLYPKASLLVRLSSLKNRCNKLDVADILHSFLQAHGIIKILAGMFHGYRFPSSQSIINLRLLEPREPKARTLWINY